MRVAWLCRRVYVDGQNVLVHAQTRPLPENWHHLSDAPGQHNGWYIDTSLVIAKTLLLAPSIVAPCAGAGRSIAAN